MQWERSFAVLLEQASAQLSYSLDQIIANGREKYIDQSTSSAKTQSLFSLNTIPSGQFLGQQGQLKTESEMGGRDKRGSDEKKPIDRGKVKRGRVKENENVRDKWTEIER